jgi:protein-tyrosine phosphatase
MAHPRGDDWLDDELSALREAGVDALVSALTTEEYERLGLADEPAAAVRAGLEFVPFPITDRGVPLDPAAAARLATNLAAQVRAGRFVAAHCWAGVGRSSLLAGATLVCLGVSPAEAWRRIGEARGLTVPDTEQQRSWLDEFAAKVPDPV